MLKASSNKGQTGSKFLLEAISKDKVHLARFVLDALDGEIIDSRTVGARTPLISSILLPDAHTRCKFVEMLLQRGAGVNCQDGGGRTALSHACERGFLDAAKILVRNNADPEVEDSWGNTALMYAAAAGHSHVVEFLVRAFKRLGLRIDRQNKAGNSAVEVATYLGHTDCISALTNHFKRGNTQPQLSLRGGDTNKLGDLHMCDHAESFNFHNLKRNPLPQVKHSRLPWLNSIEEFDRESDVTSPPSTQDFTEVLTPRPPPRILDHAPHPTGLKPTGDDHLPPLMQNCETQGSMFFSPRPNRHLPKVSAPSALGVLLTPIIPKRTNNKPGTERSKTLDFGVCRFYDSYYQKRCSLPTSVLSPKPPERTLVPPLKSKTAGRCGPSKFTAPNTASSHKTFSVLSNKLLRRFTSPEFKEDVTESGNDLMSTPGRIPRSETFPQCSKRPQIDSKPSIDSISSVKCEFDFHIRCPTSQLKPEC